MVAYLGAKLMAKGKNVLSTGEVARICHVSPRTVQKWFDKKLLNGYLIPGSKDRRIPRNELIRFMRENNIPMPSSLQSAPAVTAGEVDFPDISATSA